MAFVDSVFTEGLLHLGEGAALDLVAVPAVGELLVVGLVLAGDESFGHPEGGGLGQTNIRGKATNFASNPFHAFLAGHNSGVDVVDALDNIAHGVNIVFSMTLPSHATEGNKGGEEERETSQDKDANDDGGEVGQGLFFLVGNSIAVRGSTVSGGGGSVGGSGGSIGSCGLLIGLSGGSVAGAGVMLMSMGSVSL